MEKSASAQASWMSVDFDLDNLLHPARAFEHPRHVIDDPDLTLNEKRAILASWASDACAIEAARNCVGPPARSSRFVSTMSWTRCARSTKSRTIIIAHYRAIDASWQTASQECSVASPANTARADSRSTELNGGKAKWGRR